MNSSSICACALAVRTQSLSGKYDRFSPMVNGTSIPGLRRKDRSESISLASIAILETESDGMSILDAGFQVSF